jgi:glutaredoxin-related protein
MSDTQTRIDQLVKSNDVVLFMKGNASFPQCGFSGRAIQILKACGVDTKGIQTVRVQQLAHHPPALRQRRVCRRLGHHDGDV